MNELTQKILKELIHVLLAAEYVGYGRR